MILKYSTTKTTMKTSKKGLELQTNKFFYSIVRWHETLKMKTENILNDTIEPNFKLS